MTKLFITVSYDISDPKRLYRVAKEMKNWGVRVQKSVFECLLSEANFLKMKKAIEKLIKKEEDSVRFYILCKKCVERIEYFGNTPPPLKKEDGFEII